MSSLRSAMRSPLRSSLVPPTGDFRFNLVNQALAILRRFGSNAHVYMPGSSRVSYGPELVTANSASMTGQNAYTAINGSPSVVGKVYNYSYTVSQTSGASQGSFGGVAFAVHNGAISGAFSGQITATATNTPQFYCNFAVGTISNFTIREVITSSSVSSGLTANNFTLADGSTGYAAVDGLDGLVLDAMGGVGANVITNGDFSAGATGWSTGTQTVISGGAAVVTASASAQPFVYQPALTAGVMYLVTFTVNSVSGGSIYSFVGSAATGPGIATPGSYLAYTVAAGNSNAGIACGAGVTASVTNIKFQPITGIHATSTGAARPTLRRGLVNLLNYSNNIGPAPWTLTGASSSGSEVTYSATPTGNAEQIVACGGTANKTFTVAVKARVASGIFNFRIKNTQQGVIDNFIEQVATTASQIFVLTVTNGASAGSGSQIAGIWNSATPQAGVLIVEGVGLFQGTLTAQQILAQGGIPLTTTAAASNSTAGQYSMEFNSAQSLTMGSVPFQMADDHCVIAGATPNHTAGSDHPIFCLSGVSTTPLIYLGYTSSSQPQAVWRDDATVLKQTVGIAAPLTPQVIAARAVGVARNLYVNGVQTATTTGALGATTLTNYELGHWTAGTSFMQGAIGPVIAIKGTVTDADLLTLERFVAALTPNAPVF